MFGRPQEGSKMLLMARSCRWISVGFLPLLFAARVSMGGEPDQKGTVLVKYREAMSSLQRSLSRVQATGVLTETYIENTHQHTVTYALAYAVNGTSKRIRVRRIENHIESPGELIYLTTALANYVISCKSSTDSYALKYKGTDFARLQPAFRKYLDGYLDSVVAAHKQPLELLLTSPDCEIRKCELLGQNGVKIAKFYFDYHLRELDQHLVGWWSVRPDDAWVLHEYEMHRGSSTIRGAIQYGEKVDSIPIPERISAYYEDTDGRREYSLTFDRWVFSAAPVSDFQLSTFGLQTTVKQAGSRLRPSISALYFGSALLALVIAVMLWRLSSRVSKPGYPLNQSLSS